MQDLLLSLLSYEITLERKKGDILIGFLRLIGIVVLISMSTQLSTRGRNYCLCIRYNGCASMYLLKLSRSIQNKSRIEQYLQIFILFFLTLTVSSFLFYRAERSDVHSQTTSMGDALWWTLQTATASTFGPNVSCSEGRILGSIITLVGIGITGAFAIYPCFRVDPIQSVFDTRKRHNNNLEDEIGER